MPSPPFFNENENRAYPLVPGGTMPPEKLVVDAGFVAGPKSRFETGTHRVWLAAVRRQGSFFHLDFDSDAPELYGTKLTFSRHVDDGDFVTEFVDSGTSGLSASSLSGSTDDNPHECDEPLWSGFVVTGRMAAFLALLPSDGEATLAADVEPALVQNLAESCVVKFAVANDDRTRVSASDGCEDAAPATPGVTHVNANCVVGDVVFVPGYNANVRQSLTDNSITLGAAVGDGEGEPCDTVPLYAGENAPAGSTLLEGGPRCNETVRSVNGIGGPQLTLFAGRGVTVTSSPDDNRVVVNVNMSGLALCFDSVSARSESC
jgi:hypothetical protein